MKIGGSTAWRIITQPISDRSLFGVITGLRHVDLAHRFFRAISAPSLRHLRAIPVLSPHHPRAIPASSPPGKSVFYRMLADSGPFSWTSRCSLGAPVGLRHGDLAYRCFIAISAWRSSHLSVLRHGDPAQRCLRGIPAWRTIPQPISKRFLSGVITGLRHGDPSYSHLSALLAWQSVLLSGIRHDKLVHRYPRDIILWRDGLKPVIYLCLSMKLAFFMDVEV